MALLVAGSNILVKTPINDWITWGAFLYPFTFFVTELTNFYHGPRAARKVVYSGFFVAAVFSIFIADTRIVTASTTAFLVSQLLDIAIFSRLRRLGNWWIAPAIASIVATLIDSGMFFSIAFAGTEFPWVSVAIGTAAMKGLIDLGLLLPFRLLISKFRLNQGVAPAIAE